MQRGIVIITMLILIILVINIFYTKETKFFQEEFIFFKKLYLKENSNKNERESITKSFKENENIKVERNKNNSKTIKLEQIINWETLINKKIAPGSKGKFIINIVSNQ
ncbi:MAG: hypothetical protein HUJ68_06210, partial [Clostridia bacterium]|nr:hypothetical protein [Clostridia bacterium]